MRNLIGLATALALGSIGAIFGATTALAVPITYTETATASGSLGGVAFSNASIVLKQNGDTANVTGSGFIENRGTITLTINGGAPADITEVSGAFVVNVPNGNGIRAGFESDFANEDILSVVSPAFSTYGLTTAIGPVTGPPHFISGLSFSTTDGAFILTTVGTPTFIATLTAVAEPGSLAVFASALVGIGLLLRHRGRRGDSG